ncbi:MAG TPA: hypothetical protein VGN88_12165 [Phycisphaerae bacterium]|jgi:hypothetical protein
MKLISTDFGVGQWVRVEAEKRRVVLRGERRGTAEIELLLVIPILLTLLLLANGALSIGGAKLANVFNAENDAYGQVVAGRGLSPSANPVPVDGINGVRPSLPNRFDMADEFKNVTVNGVDVPFNVTQNDRAIFLDPAWHYSSWPNGGDRPAIQQWFDDYVGESHPANLVSSLGLAPAGPP